MRTQAKRNLPGKDRQEQAALIVAALRLDVVGLRAKGLVGALGSRNWPVVGFTFNELTKEPEDANVDAERLRLCSLIDTQEILITEGRASLKALKRKLCALDRSQSSTCTLSLSEANDTILASEPPGRWTNGAIQFSTTSTDASKVLSYLDDRNNYDFKGHLVVGSHKLGGFSNESRSQADRHNAARQWQHSTIFPHSVLKEACTKIPGFKALLGASALLPVHHTASLGYEHRGSTEKRRERHLASVNASLLVPVEGGQLRQLETDISHARTAGPGFQPLGHLPRCTDQCVAAPLKARGGSVVRLRFFA